MKSCGVSSKKASRYKGHYVTIRDARPSNALLCHSIIASLLAVNFYYWLGYTLSRLLAKIFFRFRILHRERMIQSGPVILAMNHQSFFDPPLAGNASDRAIFFLARRTLLDHWFWGWLLPKLNVIPVDQEGSDRSALKALIRILRAGQATLVFPEGG